MEKKEHLPNTPIRFQFNKYNFANHILIDLIIYMG